MSEQKKIDIIIPVYNGLEYLKPLFESVFKSSNVSYRLIIIDDRSPDPKVWEYLVEIKNQNQDREIVLQRNEENLGFVKTVNRAVKLAKGDFVLLNTDVEVPLGWLERLAAPLLEDEKVASVTPFTNSATIFSFPNFLEDNDIFEGLSVNEIDRYFQLVRTEGNHFDLPTGVGFCMFFNKKVVDEIGMFDEDSFGKGYGEENDWCQRAIKSGYKNVIAPNLFVYHKHGGSFESSEKKKLLEENTKKLLKKHPHYLDDVQKFIAKDPCKKIRDFLIVLISANFEKDNKPTIFFDHELGGGANIYREKYIENCLKKGEKIFLLTCDFAKKQFYLKYYFKEFKVSYLLKDVSEILDLCAFVEFGKIIVSQLVSYEKPLNILKTIQEIKEKQDCFLEFLVHDYFCLCPNYVLINQHGKYCGIPETSKCIECLRVNDGEYRKYTDCLDINHWRREWDVFLGFVDRVVCFSQVANSIVKKVHGAILENKMEIIPHKVDDMEYIYNLKRKKGGKLVIGILGGISFTKGSKIIEDMVSIIDRGGISCEVVVVGDFISKFKSKNLKVLGTYKREFLKKIVLESEIDVFLIPSIWPETFSYTSEEIMKMGYPLAVFNIGAPVERVRNYEKGLIISEINAQTALDEIYKIKI